MRDAFDSIWSNSYPGPMLQPTVCRDLHIRGEGRQQQKRGEVGVG